MIQDQRRRALGRRGERLAEAYLRERGLTVQERNARTRNGEIDLIARDRRTLVFIEVKTRCIGSHQRSIREDQLPLAGLAATQRARLRRLALAWLSESAGARAGAETIRFDAIGVVLDTRGRLRRLDHLADAW
jgi:putative endonuclease